MLKYFMASEIHNRRGLELFLLKHPNENVVVLLPLRTNQLKAFPFSCNGISFDFETAHTLVRVIYSFVKKFEQAFLGIDMNNLKGAVEGEIPKCFACPKFITEIAKESGGSAKVVHIWSSNILDPDYHGPKTFMVDQEETFKYRPLSTISNN